MPIEIKELHIRVSVNSSASLPSTGPTSSVSAREGNDKAGVDTIVAECVEQVLGILESKRER